MELEYLKTANSPLMWLFCIPGVLLVVVQAVLFVRKALQSAPDAGVSKEQIRSAVKSSAVTSIGPSIVIVLGAVSLIASVGGPLAWMRLAYIGAVMYELPAANIGAAAAGSTLGTNDMTMAAFANAAWVMCVCCLGWIIISALFTDKIGTLQEKVAGNNKKVMAAISAGGCMGAFAYQCFTRLFPGTNLIDFTSPQVWSMGAGMACIVVLSLYEKKRKAKWVSQFGMTIAMVFGMLVGVLFM